MIGDKLRQERERQNLSIKDIEKGTSIRALYIDAIEKGDYKTLPGEVYTKGFIRNIANYLHLDANACVKQFNEEAHPENKHSDVPGTKAAKPMPTSNMKPGRETSSSKKTEEKKSEKNAPGHSHVSYQQDFEQRVRDSHRRQTILMAIIVAAVVVVAGYFFFGNDEPEAATQTTKQSVQTKKATTQSAGQPVSAKQQSDEATYDDVEVKAKFSERCWISVQADGKTLFEGTVDKGDSKSWKADEELKLTAGNAAAVSLKYNGKDLGTLGAEGEVVEKTYRKGESDAVESASSNDKQNRTEDSQEDSSQNE